MAVDMLRKLPEELIIQISYHLEVTKDLVNLVLCGRRFHRLATHALYCTFVDDGSWLRISQFLSMILTRLDLASHVKTFSSPVRICILVRERLQISRDIALALD